MSTRSGLLRGLSTMALTLPVAVWVKDTFYSLYTVRGNSMEPSLVDGDILLVRKSDVLPRYVLGTPEEETERARILRREEGGAPRALLISRPPLVLAGQVVVFYNPHAAFPHEYNVKRVVATGGQMIQPGDRFRRIETVPSYNLWLEGDNSSKSVDSFKYGAVSKKLLVGQAERVIWPPSRWGRVETVHPAEGRAWWP